MIEGDNVRKKSRRKPKLMYTCKQKLNSKLTYAWTQIRTHVM
jgi:hypothetical protein